MIEPSPLIDEKRAIFKWVWNALMANPGIVDLLASKIDLDAMADALDIPVTGRSTRTAASSTTADPYDSSATGQPVPVGGRTPSAIGNIDNPMRGPVAASATRKRLAALAILSAAGKRAANRERLKGKRMKRRGRHA
jgi:hypothetical protein